MNALRAIPPVLAPMPWKHLLRALFDRSPFDEACERVSRLASMLLGDGRLLFFSSGRAAMVAALRAFQRESGGTEVIIPAYTCYTVPSAVAAAGLTCVTCDVSEKDFGFDLDALDRCFSRHTLCVIPTHLYGLPCDMDQVRRRAKERGVRVLEDAAQALGGSWGGAPLGTLGDVGLFSLGRGKNVTAGHGGMLLVRDLDLAREIGTQGSRAGGESFWEDTLSFARGTALGMLARPPFYGSLERVPALEIGVSRFDSEIEVAPLGGFEIRLLAGVLPLASHYLEIRERIARRYQQELAGLDQLRLPHLPGQGRAAWLRFPILLSEERKSRLLHSSARHYGLSPSYPRSVPEIPEAKPYLAERCASPAAARIAREIVTLPTHPGVRERHIRAIVECLSGLH